MELLLLSYHGWNAGLFTSALQKLWSAAKFRCILWRCDTKLQPTHPTLKWDMEFWLYKLKWIYLFTTPWDKIDDDNDRLVDITVYPDQINIRKRIDNPSENYSASVYSSNGSIVSSTVFNLMKALLSSLQFILWKAYMLSLLHQAKKSANKNRQSG